MELNQFFDKLFVEKQRVKPHNSPAQVPEIIVEKPTIESVDEVHANPAAAVTSGESKDTVSLHKRRLSKEDLGPRSKSPDATNKDSRSEQHRRGRKASTTARNSGPSTSNSRSRSRSRSKSRTRRRRAGSSDGPQLSGDETEANIRGAKSSTTTTTTRARSKSRTRAISNRLAGKQKSKSLGLSSKFKGNGAPSSSAQQRGRTAAVTPSKPSSGSSLLTGSTHGTALRRSSRRKSVNEENLGSRSCHGGSAARVAPSRGVVGAKSTSAKNEIGEKPPHRRTSAVSQSNHSHFARHQRKDTPTDSLEGVVENKGEEKEPAEEDQKPKASPSSQSRRRQSTKTPATRHCGENGANKSSQKPSIRPSNGGKGTPKMPVGLFSRNPSRSSTTLSSSSNTKSSLGQSRSKSGEKPASEATLRRDRTKSPEPNLETQNVGAKIEPEEIKGDPEPKQENHNQEFEAEEKTEDEDAVDGADEHDVFPMEGISSQEGLIAKPVTKRKTSLFSGLGLLSGLSAHVSTHLKRNDDVMYGKDEEDNDDLSEEEFRETDMQDTLSSLPFQDGKHGNGMFNRLSKSFSSLFDEGTVVSDAVSSSMFSHPGTDPGSIFGHMNKSLTSITTSDLMNTLAPYFSQQQNEGSAASLSSDAPVGLHHGSAASESREESTEPETTPSSSLQQQPLDIWSTKFAFDHDPFVFDGVFPSRTGTLGSMLDSTPRKLTSALAEPSLCSSCPNSPLRSTSKRDLFADPVSFGGPSLELALGGIIPEVESVSSEEPRRSLSIITSLPPSNSSDVPTNRAKSLLPNKMAQGQIQTGVAQNETSLHSFNAATAGSGLSPTPPKQKVSEMFALSHVKLHQGASSSKPSSRNGGNKEEAKYLQLDFLSMNQDIRNGKPAVPSSLGRALTIKPQECPNTVSARLGRSVVSSGTFQSSNGATLGDFISPPLMARRDSAS